jgi:hypothetical protein
MIELIQAAGAGLSLMFAGWSVLVTVFIGVALLTGELASPGKGAGFVAFWVHVIYGLVVIGTVIGLNFKGMI